MKTHPLAGKPAPSELSIDLAQLEAAFYETKPDPDNPNQLVSFGTSGHRGTSSNGTFTEAHILADHTGDLRVPAQTGDHGTAVHGKRHPCAFAAGRKGRP